MTPTFTFEDLKGAVEAGDIDTVLVCMVDMQGRLIGKRCDARFFVDEAHREVHACDYLLANDIEMEPVPGYAAANWAKGYGDFAMVPDPATLAPIPWLDATALVLCDVVDHRTHVPLAHSPRAILKQQVARLAERGLVACAASELEFYLFDETYESAREKGYANLATAARYIEDYHIFQTTKEEGLMQAVRRGLAGAGIPVETTKGEWGPGQEEINVRYADPLTMADRHAIIKNGIKEIAWAQGKAITFMAKWSDDVAGSSCHVHMSLREAAGETAAFHDPAGDYGMSGLMRSFVAGQLAYAPEITWFLAPYINSYKRFQAGKFAPTKLVWSRDNRTAGFRLVGEGSPSVRIECRMGGADLNPHLAIAALLAAGMAGVDRDLELEPPFAGDAYVDHDDLRDVPRTLRDATALMDGSGMLRAAFGDAVIDHYVHTARWEQADHDRHVTDRERARGFERY